MIKALFVDFYGTVVHEDGAVIKVITQMIKDTGDGSDTSDIDSFGGMIFGRCFLTHMVTSLRHKEISSGNHWNTRLQNSILRQMLHS